MSVVVAMSLSGCSEAVRTSYPPAPSTPPTATVGEEVDRPCGVFDDFDGPANTPPSSQHWIYDLGRPGAANHELQTYTNSLDNVRIDGQGRLIIQARKTPTGYTSGRVATRGKVDTLYGTTSARIKFPSGQGIWTAFWMLGSNIETVWWPQCGEIDIMELVSSGTTFHATLHGPQGNSDYRQGNGVGTRGSIPDLTRDFHTYWVDRQRNSIIVGVDAKTLAEFTPASLPSGARWVFNQPMYATLNVAVGGDWPGPPDQSTPFPSTMLVDWFRFTPSAMTTGHR